MRGYEDFESPNASRLQEFKYGKFLLQMVFPINAEVIQGEGFKLKKQIS